MNRRARVPRAWMTLVVVLAACASLARAGATVVVGSSSVPGSDLSNDRESSHGWVVVEGESSLVRNTRSWLIVHIPPRRSVGADGATHGVPDGSVRQILPAVQENPVALAAWRDGLYVISEANTIFPQAQRQVGSVRVVPTGVGDYWVSQPTHRLQTRPSLAGGGEVLGAVGSPAGPIVLVAREGAAGESPSLWLRALVEGAWRELVLPRDLRALLEREGRVPTNDPAGGRWWRLVGTAHGIEIWSALYGAAEAQVWTVEPVGEAVVRAMQAASKELAAPSKPEVEDRPVKGLRERRRDERERRAIEAERLSRLVRLRVEWTGTVVPLPQAAPLASAPRVLDLAGRRVLVTWNSQSEASVFARQDALWRELWRGAVPNSAGVVGLPGCGRVSFVWATGMFNTPGFGLQFIEISANTGRVMYAGPAKSSSPVTPTDLRFIAIFLLGASAAVLLFVLKSEAADKAFHLPEGTALAEGWRRGLATMMDFGLAMMIAAEVRGVDLGESVSVSGWLTGKGMPVLVTGLVIACAACTVFEWMFGRSLGKMIAGCEVVDVSGVSLLHDETGQSDLPRPSFFRSLVRNAVKWAFPPVGIFMVLDAAGRHPGDVFAKTAVVCWLPEDGDADGV